MPIDKIDLSVIIPSYHEEDNLRMIIPRIKNVLNKENINFELIVVDTVEPIDHTKNICNDLGVIYLNREHGNYYGDAVRTGIKEAKGSFVLFMDADGSHSPEFILKMFSCRKRADVVIASRYVKGGGSDNSWILKLMSKIVNIIFSVVLNLHCKDVSNSFRIYDSKQLKNVNLICHNFDIVEEILVKLIKQNKKIKITEVPFFFRERMFGHSKRSLLKFVFSYVMTLIKLRLMK